MTIQLNKLYKCKMPSYFFLDEDRSELPIEVDINDTVMLLEFKKIDNAYNYITHDLYNIFYSVVYSFKYKKKIYGCSQTENDYERIFQKEFELLEGQI